MQLESPLILSLKKLGFKMLVKCINDNFSEIESQWVIENFEAYSNINERLSKGETYVVYAIEFSKVPFVYIVEDDDFDFYPLQFPLELFEIIDNRLSKYFCYGNSKINLGKGNTDETVPLLAFKEWVEIKDFWEGLSNYNAEYEKIFKRNKELLDYEFFNPKLLQKGVRNTLETLSDDWVMCGNCDNSWRVQLNNEMIKCSKCDSVYENPFTLKSAL